MQISKEARSAACDAFDQAYFHDAKDSDERLYLALMAALEAALAAAPAVAEPEARLNALIAAAPTPKAEGEQ